MGILGDSGYGGGFTGGFDLPSIMNITAGQNQANPLNPTQEPGFWGKTKGWLQDKDNINTLAGAMQSLARIIDPESPQVKAGDTIFGQKNLAALLSTLKQGTEFSEKGKDGSIKTLKTNPLAPSGGEGGGGLGNMSESFDSELYKGIMNAFAGR